MYPGRGYATKLPWCVIGDISSGKAFRILKWLSRQFRRTYAACTTQLVRCDDFDIYTMQVRNNLSIFSAQRMEKLTFIVYCIYIVYCVSYIVFRISDSIQSNISLVALPSPYVLVLFSCNIEYVCICTYIQYICTIFIISLVY